jgi:hemerythrin-like domain-containing protein
LKPTDILKDEHQVILLVLDAAEREAVSIRATGRVNAEKVGQMLEFFRNFADRCHHAKEEKLLFPRLQERGLPAEGGPIAAMLGEHDEGRKHLQAVSAALPEAETGDRAGMETIASNLTSYVELLRSHISKEDSGLFPTADGLLTEQDNQALAASFEKAETDEMGEGAHELYHKLAHELAGN